MECEGSGEMAVLDLRHCSLTSVPTDIFKAEPNLEEVYLDANQIRELPRVSTLTNPCKVYLSAYFRPSRLYVACVILTYVQLALLFKALILSLFRFARRRCLGCKVCTSSG